MENEIVVIEKALCEFSRAEIKEMVAQFETLKVIPGDKASYKMVNDARNKFVHLRNDIDKKRKKLNEDAQAEIKSRNDTAKELIALFSPAETHLTNEIKAEDDRIAKIEAERKERIQARIAIIPAHSVVGYNDTAEIIQSKINIITEFVVDDTLEEFQLQAENTKKTALALLSDALTARIKFEKEEAERIAETARLKKIADEQEATRLAQEEAKKVIDAENARLKAESDKIEQAKKDADNKKFRERISLFNEDAYIDDGKVIDSKSLFTIIEVSDILSISEDDLKALKDKRDIFLDGRKQAERVRLQKEADELAEKKLKEKQAADKLKAEQEAEEAARVAALAPDKDKLKGFARVISQVISAPPEIKDKDLKASMDAILTTISAQVTKLLKVAGE